MRSSLAIAAHQEVAARIPRVTRQDGDAHKGCRVLVPGIHGLILHASLHVDVRHFVLDVEEPEGRAGQSRSHRLQSRCKSLYHVLQGRAPADTARGARGGVLEGAPQARESARADL